MVLTSFEYPSAALDLELGLGEVVIDAGELIEVSLDDHENQLDSKNVVFSPEFDGKVSLRDGFVAPGSAFSSSPSSRASSIYSTSSTAAIFSGSDSGITSDDKCDGKTYRASNQGVDSDTASIISTSSSSSITRSAGWIMYTGVDDEPITTSTTNSKLLVAVRGVKSYTKANAVIIFYIILALVLVTLASVGSFFVFRNL